MDIRFTHTDINIEDSKCEAMSFFWKRFGHQIEEVLFEFTGLSFLEESVTCNLNTARSFSSPLSLKINSTPRYMENDLIHELIHVLFTQNYEHNPHFKDKWDAYWKLYPDESRLTKSHIPVHAIHFLVMKKIFPRRFIAYDSRMKDYVKSWDIVIAEGALNIAKYIK